MPEDTQVAGDASQTDTKKTTPPAEVEIKVRGKKQMVPLDKVVTWAQQGLNQESTAKQLQAERAALEGDGARYREYQAYRDYMEAHPTTARAVQAAIRNPDSVLNPQVAASADTDDPDADLLGTPRSTGALPPEVTQELQSLHSKIAELVDANQSRSDLEAENLARSAIESEANSYPWLKSDKVAPLAQDRIKNIMKADPRSSLAAVTASVASEFQDLIQAEQTIRIEKANDRKQLRVEKPARWTPELSMKTPPTKKDLQDGNLLKLTKEAARAFGLPVD